ncbi:hypothetical protein KFK09_013713 [Dendrobium nobile]|uniref:Uncharacterized protein n=1 Tax=Dendrobium nobile TaxID=94219 RepID=A0A8T3B878_DENNO|nr:hypothetical protein KFK09_013713 [Dendrobium nobile]
MQTTGINCIGKVLPIIVYVQYDALIHQYKKSFLNPHNQMLYFAYSTISIW